MIWYNGSAWDSLARVIPNILNWEHMCQVFETENLFGVPLKIALYFVVYTVIATFLNAFAGWET
jgi:hypothetical protein